MGQACGMYDGKIHKEFFIRNLEETNRLEDLGVNGRIILKYILKTRRIGVQWVHLAVDRDKWRALVHMATGQLRIPKRREFFLTTYNKLLASQQGLCFT